MCIRSLAILLLCSVAVGQATSPSPVKPSSKPASSATGAKAQTPDSGSTVPASAAVITIEGICDTPAAKGAGRATQSKAACKTVVTRGEFEALAGALQPNMNAAMKRRLADVYPKMLIMAHEARKRGLENDPKYKQVLQFAKLQILAQELSKSLKDESDKVSDAEIQKYYKESAPAFEQADLKRLFIPKDKQGEADGQDEAEQGEKPAGQPANASTQKPADQKAAEPQKTAEQKKADEEAKKKADEEAMKKEAESLHTRAAAGEDFDKLQKEAFDLASIKGTPPSTSVGKLTANEVPPNHRAALDVKPGQVSDIISEANGYYIYKVIAKDTKPLEQARDQIRATLAQQKMQDTVQKIQDSAKTNLNETYFAAAAPATMPGAGGPPTGGPPTGGPGGMRPPTQPVAPAPTAPPAKAGETGQAPASTPAPPPKN
jgi:hypothetical protein